MPLVLPCIMHIKQKKKGSKKNKNKYIYNYQTFRIYDHYISKIIRINKLEKSILNVSIYWMVDL
jgi:hypothetical protein